VKYLIALASPLTWLFTPSRKDPSAPFRVPAAAPLARAAIAPLARFSVQATVAIGGGDNRELQLQLP